VCSFVSPGIYLPRDTLHSADYTRRLSLCLSVRLSHAGILSTPLNISSKAFSPSSSPTILVFPYQTGRQYSDGNPLTGAWNARRVWNNHDFRPISRFISEMMQDRAIVTMEGEWKTATKLSNGTSLNDLEWSLTQISRTRYYSTSNNSKMVQDRATVIMADQ